MNDADTLRSLGDESTMVKYFAIKLPEALSFAGEAVPLHDFEVRERLDRELLVNTYWHSNTLQNLKLAHRWFPMIEKIFAENGIPDDFKYIALAESGLRNVVSPSNAEGVWQFLAETGKQYGLRINSEVDERYDVEKSTEAAVKYFQEARVKFNNWTLSAASYNAGMGGIESNLKYQKVNNYYDLFLNQETSRYIFRVLAFKVIYENTEKFGFMLDDEDVYDPLTYKTIDVNASITNLADFAIQSGTNYKMLKYYNPWLRSSALTVKNGEQFKLKLPDNSK
ncbi:MAG: lytic transglycosylase domain-containing protein [Chitinophagales bacterium]|nr:lytic transglycosylase domain-containing protein [Chitinophagales bacterium]